MLMDGYYKRPEMNEAAFTADGHYKTGDAGELTEDGYLRLNGRIKDIIILASARNVFPADVESVIMRHEAITDVGVVGVPNVEMGIEEEVKVFYVPAASSFV